jgi:nicotinamidase-related amidase
MEQRKMHAWRIEQREYDRQESRRGRRHAYLGLEPARTALVVFLGRQFAEIFAASGGEGSLRSKLWHEFAVNDADLLVEKTAASAFFPGACTLPDLLQERGIDTVVITGTVTNVYCESSARDASTLGYRVILVADANSARRDEDHNATLYTIYRTFGDGRTTDDVIGLITQ